MSYKIVAVVGTRPQLVKCAALRESTIDYHSKSWDAPYLVDTGQHYDRELSELVKSDLGLRFDLTLRHRPGDRSRLLGSIAIQLDTLFAGFARPAAVLVMGDTYSTLLGAQAAARARLPVIYAEAGLGAAVSGHPESDIRRTVSSIASVSACWSERAATQLRKVVGEKVIFVFEDPHLAYLRRQLDGYPASGPLADGPPYALVTLHKAAHLTKPIVESLWKALRKSGQHAVLLLTPQLSRLLPAISKPPPCVVMLDAQPPRATWRLIAGAQFVLTDSGTLPREAAALGTRSLLLREITGNGELVELGFARVAGHSASRIAAGIAWARIAPPLQPWPAPGAASWTTIIDHAVASLPNA